MVFMSSHWTCNILPTFDLDFLPTSSFFNSIGNRYADAQTTNRMGIVAGSVPGKEATDAAFAYGTGKIIV